MTIKKMKRLLTLLLSVLTFTGATAQEIEMTTTQAKSYYKNTAAKQRTSVHDPSVVYEPTSKRYYVFGSHKAGAYTTNMQNWTWAAPKWKVGTNQDAANKDAFVTPAVKKVTKGGAEVDFPQFNAEEWSHRTQSDYNVDGNMWAPDVIWNPTMQKWCMYLSINGDAWHSSIILLTSDKITGPYGYQGPVVICGFQDSGHSYKGTDLELVLGQTLSSLPSRYNVGSNWGRRWPHTIDPAAFYDEEGKLWLVYGSWSGGIWMLELNEENGLRDYDVTYPSTGGTTDGVTSDPYFGTKIGGGYYVSGEGPYIEYIGGYYYLFVSYGFYSPDGGYEMRVFRSDKPNGPYKDALNRSAIFTSYVMNYGTGSETRGEKLMGAYNDWGYMTVGECAQGHNSVIAAEDGRTYLVYHTKFNNGTAGHQVRVHQVFQNKQGWLVAAPFEYNGEETLSADVAAKQLVADSDIPGIYQVLLHKYKMDYANMEEVTPKLIDLHEDGTVSGAYSGTWSIEQGTSYLTIKLGGTNYNGVLFEQQIDGKTIKTINFSAMANSGANVWGYKYRADYALAWHLNNMGSLPISNNTYVVRNYDLHSIEPTDKNVSLSWTTSQPSIISEYGVYYPVGLAEDTPVELQARLTSGNYFWQQTFNVTARSEENAKAASTTWQDNMLARYKFDDEALSNSLNPEEKASLKRNSTTAVPTVETTETMRNGGVVHTAYGANKKESFVGIPNPLKGRDLSNGATISFFVKRTDNNLWDALFGMTDGTARLFMTGNLYVGFNDGVTADASAGVYNNWIDINHPGTKTYTDLGVGSWHLLTVTFKPSVTSTNGGITIYVDGKKHTDVYNMQYNGKSSTLKTGFTNAGYKQLVDFMATCDQLYLGNGSFWGSADARFDDLVVYDRELSLMEVMALYQMTNRAESSYETLGIGQLSSERSKTATANDAVYDLMGRKVETLKPGLYIRNGKKFIVR